ncbi:MAG: hypothetical protein ACR2NU_11900 [Aeoliella sp.]
MPWFSKSLRRSQPARITLTTTAAAGARADALLASWFLEFDSRGLPATWGVVTDDGGWPLGPQLLQSQVGHELAMRMPQAGGDRGWTGIAAQATLARRAQLPLRSLIVSGDGVHPSLLARLGVEAVVTCSKGRLSRTGSLRAMAWNLWEIPVTDAAPQDATRSRSQRFTSRLDAVIRHSTRMHLLLELGEGSEWLLSFLDGLAELRNRGIIVIETVGMAAAEASRSMTSAAA